MSFKNRALILILSAVLLFVPLVSCKDKNQSAKNSETVLTIDGTNVPYDLYRCIALTQKKDYESKYGTDVWTGNEASQIKDNLDSDILSHLKSLYSILSLGKDYEITADDALITDEVESKRAADVKEYGGEKQFSQALSDDNMTDSVYRFLVSAELIKDEVYYAMIKAGDINTDENFVKSIIDSGEFIRIKQILISSTNGKTDEENLERAKTILALARDGKDFDELVSEYNEDLYMFNNTHGYYIIKGVRHKDFENAAFDLEIGEISDIVKTDSGYSIIKRYEKEPQYIEDNFDSLAEAYYDSVFSITRENREEEMKVQTTGLYNSLDVLTIE